MTGRANAVDKSIFGLHCDIVLWIAYTSERSHFGGNPTFSLAVPLPFSSHALSQLLNERKGGNSQNLNDKAERPENSAT
jgi:hypothetical protein